MILDPLTLQPVFSSQILSDGALRLEQIEPVEAQEYILKLACKDRYNVTPREQLSKGLEHIKYAWICKNEDGVGGVAFMCYLEHMNWWTLDAYKEDSVDNKHGDWSFRTGRLAIDWFFTNNISDSLYTIHRTQNRGATKVCQRIGFEIKYANPQFVILKMRRNTWALKH